MAKCKDCFLADSRARDAKRKRVRVYKSRPWKSLPGQQSESDLAWLLARASEPNENGCRLWLRATRNGYGYTKRKGFPLKAHRAVYAAAFGPIPNGVMVCHKCDVPRCVEPSHLFVGTGKDNVRDALKKLRLRPNGKKTLNIYAVRVMRWYAARGRKHKDIAAVYSKSRRAVSEIIRGDSWAWVV